MVKKVFFLEKCTAIVSFFLLLTLATGNVHNLYGAADSLERLQQQVGLVSGIVSDAKNGEPIIGATIIIKGTTTGTISNIQGEFTIEVPDGSAVIVISYVGYETIEVPVNLSSKMNIVLSETAVGLNEVIIVGYGSQKKQDLTSSISSISAKDLKGIPTISTDALLQGKAAGVQVMTNTGAPGSTVSVKIRGVITTGDAQPLYVVDGMPMSSGGGDNAFGINSLNPNDIESVQILKDASSAAIYGSRGSNGVILITTKRGKAGKPSISLDTYYGIQSQAHRIDILNKSQYKQYYDMLAPYRKPTANYPDYEDLALFAALPDFDWQKEILNPAPISNVQLSVSGGNENSVYMISVANTLQNGMVKGSDYNRTNFRINSDHTITKWLKFGESLSLSNSVRHRVMEGGVGYNFISASPLIAALLSDPTTEAYAADGSVNYMRHSGTFNGAGIRDRANYTYNNKKLNGNMYFEITFFKGLKFKTNLGLDYNLGELKEFQPSFLVEGSPLNEGQLVPSLKQTNEHESYLAIENTLSYTKNIGKHAIGLMAGSTAEQNSYHDIGGFNSTISGNQEYLQYLDAGNPADLNRAIWGGAGEWRMYSYLARLTYAFDDRYLLTGSVREDASSRFGPNNRIAVFPALSVGWKIKNETFLKDVDWIYSAKVRVGWGQVGNQNNIGRYSYNTAIQPDANYAFGNPKVISTGVTAGVMNSGYDGSAGGKPGNKSLKWETTQTKDVGIDLSFFKNKLSFTADWFLKDNIGMLMQSTVPDYLGIVGPDINGGKIANQGFEVELGYRKMEGNLTFDFNGNITYIKTEVIELDKPNFSNYIGAEAVSRTLTGGGIADFWGYKTDGVFRNDQELAQGPYQINARVGDIRFKDVDGDGSITVNDQTVLGSSMPKYTFGFTSNVYYKSFDLNLFFQGFQGNMIYNNLYRAMMGKWGVNKSPDILNSWTPENPNSTIPRFGEGSANNNDRIPSDRWLEDGSFLRLKTISLGYTLPKTLVTKASVQNLRVYVTIQNALTFTKYSGFDPEVSQSVGWGSGGLDMGIDNGNYPQPRTLLFGFNLSF
jgi:TonB-linked SusC/RagA family outer membrane protein